MYILDEFHEFGKHCIIRKEDTNKFEPQGTEARWLCIDEQSKGHRIYLNGKIHVKQNI